MLGIKPNNLPAPNGLGFELKSVSYIQRDGLWLPKETMAVTMLNSEQLLSDDFFHSHLWEKMKRLVFCVLSYEGPHSTESKLLDVKSLDCLEDDTFIKGANADYEFIRTKLRTKGYGAITGKDGNWIQARTKGAGHGSTSRAFYAKKKLLLAICPPIQIAA